MRNSSLTNQMTQKEIQALKDQIQALGKSVEALKQKEKLLQDNEMKYKLITEKMTDIVWILDKELRTAYTSPSVEKILGFTPDERNNQAIKEQITPSSLTMVLDLLAREMEIDRKGPEDPERSQTLELESYHKDGSTRWLEVSVGAIRDEQAVIIGYHGVSRDITKRRKAEESLKNTEANFRRTFDESPLGVRIVSAEGDTIFANQAILNIYGYDSVEEFKATSAHIRYMPESYAAFQKRREQRRRGEDGPSEYEISIIRKDREIRYLHVLRKKILWDGKWQYQAIYEDITDRKNIEEALRKREEYFRELVENISDIIFTVDEKGIITYVSPSVERQVGYRPEELIGTSVFDLFTEEDLPRALSAFAKSIITKKETIPNCFRIKHKNGKELVMEGVGRNLLHNPAIASIVTNVRDVTEKTRAEEERIKLETKLKLSQKMEAIGTIAGGVAHDFNNLLLGIQGHVSMSFMNIDPSHPNYERLKHIEEIIDSGSKLTRQLLGFARGERKEVKAANMNEIIDQTTAVRLRIEELRTTY